MKNSLLSLLFMLSTLTSMCAEHNVSSVSALLDRIGGEGTHNRIETILDASIPNETFVITSFGNKPCIKGSTLSALTCGINWYLNHHAHVNLSWNCLTTNLSKTTLPLPTAEEHHTCDAQYRYYLNYCTFSYSMSTWTWSRWEKEIDWMALHGINMPLQIIGLDVVWRNLLTLDYGYTNEEANAFIAGPAFQAWWGMNNLEGWGGPNPDWWYTRQEQLCKKILSRQRELGITPVLPGFSGMVPSNFHEKTGAQCESQGGWCGFQRPFILDPTSAEFGTVASHYYTRLHELMGTSRYYSMDPFHEGGSISSGKYAEGYRSIFEAMHTHCGPDTKWVIQQWQWSQHQALSLTAVPQGRLIVLDLFSDGQPAFDRFQGYAPQEAIYCAIPNFGGRTGFFGRIPKMADNYYNYKHKYPSIRGIGAAPEAIEQTPVVYDLLFELPWLSPLSNTLQSPLPPTPASSTSCSAVLPQNISTSQWITNYATARYGTSNPQAQQAWLLLHNTILNNTTNLQGPQEAVTCARPATQVNSVSTWGGCDIFYDPDSLVAAVKLLLSANIPSTKDKNSLAAHNYSYDLIDLTRQALTDHSKALLDSIHSLSSAQSKALLDSIHSISFDQLNDNKRQQAQTAFLQLILDLDHLLASDSNFRLGTWTSQARAIADEVPGTTETDRNWLELNNARTLITTWGDEYPSESGGLRDYSYRQWQGMLRDYYYPRWQYFFSHNMQSPTHNMQSPSCNQQSPSWFQMDWQWAHNPSHQYESKPQGSPKKIARKLMKKYFP